MSLGLALVIIGLVILAVLVGIGAFIFLIATAVAQTKAGNAQRAEELEWQAMQDRDTANLQEEEGWVQGWFGGETLGLPISVTRYYPTDFEADNGNTRMIGALGYVKDADDLYDEPVYFDDGSVEYRSFRRVVYTWSGRLPGSAARYQDQVENQVEA